MANIFVNAFLAIRSDSAAQALALVSSGRAKVEAGNIGQVTNAEKNAMGALKILADSRFAKTTIGANEWILFNIVTTPEILEKIDQVIPNSVVAGCWNEDGTQYGQVLSHVVDHVFADGTIRTREEITGAPVYPIHPKLIDFMPDEVEYNADGTERSRKRPTKLKQIHKYLGWADRRWT